MEIFLSIIFGFLFGFILYKIGASNPVKIINMLRFKDFHLAKVILFAIGLSSLSIFMLQLTGLINPHFSIKAAYIGVMIGGLIFGIGWSFSGFCPGSGLAALGAKRKDALFFILGGLVGAFLFMISFSYIKSTFLFFNILNLNGKITIMDTNTVDSLLDGSISILITGMISIIFILIAYFLPSNQDIKRN